jgi:hypothetical protein
MLILVGAVRAADAPGVAFFEQNVRPLLVVRCYECHSHEAKKLRGGLYLDSQAGWQKGGDSGPALVPGDPDKSLLIKAIRYADDLQMPPKGKLSAKEIDVLTQWVKMGAPDPRTGTATASRTIDVAKARDYWAFKPLTNPVPPEVRDAGWCRTPLDRFILAKLDAKGLTPNPPIDRRKLIRRVTFDLVGLPPTPEEIDAFVNDPSPDAYPKLIDRLLASPHFGERWARHWLDLARFGESHGYEQDYDRPNAYHYRDFVIKAFNADLPYDTFVKWQIAGDELDPDNPLALMATGFLAAGTHATQITANQAEKERYDELDDMTRTIGTTMLGLTVGCARCHDHKFDPIPNADYYRLVATFATTVRSDYDVNLDPSGDRKAKTAFDAEHARFVAARTRFEREELPGQFAGWRRQVVAEAARNGEAATVVAGVGAALLEGWTAPHWFRLFDPDWRRLVVAEKAHARRAPKPKTVKALISSEGVPAVRLHTQGLDFYDPVYALKRGDLNQKVTVATPGYLQVLTRTPDAEGRWKKPPSAGGKLSYRRTALAEWLADTECGAGHLLARVIVNRLWQHHLGRGIVATPSDFGAQGEKPTHPELLDYLASELIRNGWRLKPIHKLILTSAVYVQNDDADERRAAIDRENTLWWRRAPRRLEAEAVRDAMLAASGALDPTLFGPGTLDPNQRRRSIYFFVKRSRLVPMMTVFDAPDSLQDVASRVTTTVAPQALMLMNSPVVRGYAAVFAQRLKNDDPGAAVRAAYLRALGREPGEAEAADALAFLKQQAADYQGDGKPDAALLALTDFCQTLLCLNEFVYVD